MGYDEFEESIRTRFRCAKCHGSSASVRSLAMTGTGLSRLLDLQHNKYVFVSCTQCGYTEVYDKNVVSGGGMDVLDMIFGS